MRAMKWHREHLPDPLPAEPLELAASWLAEATRQKVQPNPNAMVLATADASGQPSARVVLCKEISPQPGVPDVLHQLPLAQGPRAARQPARRRRHVLGRAASTGARRGPDRAGVGGRERRLLCVAQLAEPPGRLGQPAERTDRLARRTARQGGEGGAAPCAPGAGRRAAAGSRTAHRAPAALGRLPAVGRSRGTVGRGQCAHPRPGALAAHLERREPMASRPVRGPSRGCSLEVRVRRQVDHVAHHPPGRFCSGILFFVAVGSWLDQHRTTSWEYTVRVGRVPGQRRRQRGRGRLHCGAR